MSKNHYQIKTMTRDGLLRAIDWAAQEAGTLVCMILNRFFQPIRMDF